MIIKRITTRQHPKVEIVTEVLNTDRLKEKARNIFEVIARCKERIKTATGNMINKLA